MNTIKGVSTIQIRQIGRSRRTNCVWEKILALMEFDATANQLEFFWVATFSRLHRFFLVFFKAGTYLKNKISLQKCNLGRRIIGYSREEEREESFRNKRKYVFSLWENIVKRRRRKNVDYVWKGGIFQFIEKKIEIFYLNLIG